MSNTTYKIPTNDRGGLPKTLKAPFTYSGGKGRVAAHVWSRFGEVQRVVEPFCGSAIFTLSRPEWHKPGMEILGDLDGLIVNVYRAMVGNPLGLAYLADRPTIHADLAAAHRRIVEVSRAGLLDKLKQDLDYYDTEIAALWLWGMSIWIAAGWCAKAHEPAGQSATLGIIDGRPSVDPLRLKGNALSAQAESNKLAEKRPIVSHKGLDGNGISAQAISLQLAEKRPHVSPTKPSGHGVEGVNWSDVEVDELPPIEQLIDKETGALLLPWKGQRLIPWFTHLAYRLRQTIILNRDAKKILNSDTLMGTVRTSVVKSIGVFLDPPYKLSQRSSGIYSLDGDEGAFDAWEWAKEKGEDPRFRIAYCALENDFDVPEGWSVGVWSNAGNVGKNTKVSDRPREVILFSPHCLEVGEELEALSPQPRAQQRLL